MSRNSENKQEIEAQQREVKLETKDLEKKQEIEAQQREVKLHIQKFIDKIEAIADSDPEGLTELLDEAILKNWLPAVESAFAHGAKIINHFGTLRLAFINRNLEIARLVLKEALPILNEDDWYRILITAFSSGDMGIINLILDKMKDQGLTPDFSSVLLEHAISSRSEEAVNFALEEGAPIVNEGDDDDDKTLTRAFSSGNMGIINLILDKMKEQGLTPDFSSVLESAVYSGSEEAVKFALEKGAPIVNEGDDYDKTLTRAFSSGNMGIINLILDKMKEQGLTPDFSSVLLAYAIYSGSEKAVQFAIEKGAPIVPNILREHEVLKTALEGPNQKIIDMVLIAGPPIENPLEYPSLTIEKRQELTQRKKELLETIKKEAFDVSFALAKTSIPPEIFRDIASFIENPLLSLAKKARLIPESLEEKFFTSVRKTYAKRIAGESKEDKSPGRPKVEESGQLKPVKQSEAFNQSEPRTFTDIIKSNNQNQGLLLI